MTTDAFEPDDHAVAALLAPLERLEPISLAGRRHNRRRKLLLLGAVALAVFAAGAAVADSVDPFVGIGAAKHPKRASDTLDAGVQDQLRIDEVPPGGVDQIGGRLTDSARLVGALPDGTKIYVVGTTKGRLCLVVAHRAESCGEQLSRSEPVTFIGMWEGPGAPALAYGVALDDVRAVSFAFRSRHVTVAVHDNFYAYETAPLDTPPQFGGMTVTFKDGTTQTIG
jgi:hypothetical protein